MIRTYFIEPWGRLFRQPSFVVCTVLLILCTLGLRAGAKWLQWNFRKESIPLRKPLGELNRSLLGPYQVIDDRRMPKEIENELGTEEYLDWTLADTSAGENDPARYLRLFIAYYTGNPDKVPHVPDQCLTANGALVTEKENTDIKVPDIGLKDEGDRLPVRILDVEFVQLSQQATQRTVVYFFAVNGEYRCTRTQVRLRLNNWSDRYAYFSKVEISVAGRDNLPREQALRAVEKLCQTLVPVLWSEHWPDWGNLPQR